MNNPINTYINNLSKSKVKTAFYPTPTGMPIKNTVGQNATAPTPTGKPLGSLPATTPKPTVITPPQKNQVSSGGLPKSGQDYINNLKTNFTNIDNTNVTTGDKTTTVTTEPKITSKDNYLNAYKSYIDSLKESADIKQAKQAYNDYVANIAKSKAGLEGQGRGIPLQIVRGQQEKLLGQTQPEAERLLNEIAIVEGSQKATQDSLKAGVDMYGKQLELEKPIEVDGQLYKVGEDGSYTKVKGIEKELAKPTSAQEYEYAKSQGYTGTYQQYQNEDANRKLSIARAGAGGVGGTNLDSKQYTALNQITTKFQADPIINQAVKGNTAAIIADQIIANPSKATNQLKSLYVLVKNLDPDSAVREGELALANQTQSYLQQFNNTLTRITEGRVVSPEAAKELALATKELMSAWNETATRRQKQYNSQANTLNIGNEFASYIQGSDLGYNQPQQTTTSKFDYLAPQITIKGKNAYLPRSVWASLSGADKDELLAEAKADGYPLLIN